MNLTSIVWRVLEALCYLMLFVVVALVLLSTVSDEVSVEFYSGDHRITCQGE